MSAQDFNQLWAAIDVIETQEHLAMIRAVQFPHLKKQAKIEREKKLFETAYPRHVYKKGAKDVAFLISKLGGPNGK